MPNLTAWEEAGAEPERGGAQHLARPQPGVWWRSALSAERHVGRVAARLGTGTALQSRLVRRLFNAW